MKGHSFNIMGCKKCGLIHLHPKGMLGKSNKGVHLGSKPWNKGLTKYTDERVARYGKKNSQWKRPEKFIQNLKKQGIKALNKYIHEHPEHQRHAGLMAALKSPIGIRMKKTSKPQIKLFEIIKTKYKDADLEHRFYYSSRGEVRVFSLDIAIPSIKTNIEYDGDDWHSNQKRDKGRDTIINLLGWSVVRVNEKKLEEIEKGGIECVLL